MSADVFAAPAGMADVLGEPSIGVDGRNGLVMFQSGFRTFRVTFQGQASASWEDVTSPSALDAGDPVLWTDPDTGRSIESQEFFTCSAAAVTDDDGRTWRPSQGCGLGVFADHQSIAGGPFAAAPAVPHPLYPNAIYYCGQDGGFTGGTAYCARSDDGGLTFGVGVPIYNKPPTDDAGTAGVCAPLHGKVRVGFDGSVYVPNKDCAGRTAVTVSTDNGQTWRVRAVPGSSSQRESDPAVGIGARGTVYVAWEQGASSAVGSKAYVAVSSNRGQTWNSMTDLGARFGLKNVKFPQVVAGDDESAAVAFLGTSTPGDDQRGSRDPRGRVRDVFGGVWNLYVAVTHDRGGSWQVLNATAADPVQRGCIHMVVVHSSACRNLLDFNDIAVDGRGNVLVAFTDGCINQCVRRPLPPDRSYADNPDYQARRGSIVRINSARLFKQPRRN